MICIICIILNSTSQFFQADLRVDGVQMIIYSDLSLPGTIGWNVSQAGQDSDQQKC